MRSLEWPAQMSPCLQIFIASLLDDSTASVTHEIQRLPSALVLAAENGPVRDEGVGYAHKLIATEMADAVIRYDGRAVRVGRRSWKHLELTGSKRSEGRDIIMKYEAMASELKTTPIMFTVLPIIAMMLGLGKDLIWHKQMRRPL